MSGVLELELSAAAMRSLVEGNELVFEVPDAQLQVVLRADAEMVDSFKRQVSNALLHLLPVSPTQH